MSEVLVKLTGLWEKQRRGNPEGQCYLVGRLGAAKILAFKNRNKQSDSDPDWNLFLTEPSPPRQDRPPAHDAARGHQTDQALRERADQWQPPPQSQSVRSAGAGVLSGAGRSEELDVPPLPPGGDEIPF